jgi:hypothetical protein
VPRTPKRVQNDGKMSGMLRKTDNGGKDLLFGEQVHLQKNMQGTVVLFQQK